MGSFLHQKHIKNYILQLCWCNNECNAGWIYYVFIVIHFFLLILKEIKTFSGAPQIGPLNPELPGPSESVGPEPSTRLFPLGG